jgi:hypothetical protein
MPILQQNIVILASPRVGGSYVGSLLGHLHKLQNCQGSAALLSEAWNAKRIKAISNLISLNHKNNIVSKIETQTPQFQTYVGAYTLKDSTYEEKIEAGDYIYRTLTKSNTAYVCKVHTDHLEYLFKTRFINLLTRDNTTSIIVYRRDIEDAVLSYVIAMYSSVWNTGYNPEVVDHSFHSTNQQHLDEDALRGTYDNIIVDISQDTAVFTGFIREYLYRMHEVYYYWYNKLNWDIAIAYEDLSGDPITDFQQYFDNKLSPLSPDLSLYKNNRKLLTKEEKIRKLADYGMFRSILDSELKKLNMPLFLDRLH